MSGVSITATFGKKEATRNGLDVLAEDLAHEQPPGKHYVIGVVECVRVNINRAAGDAEVPAVRFVGIEAVLTPSEVKTVKTIYEKRYRNRTGNGPEPELPLDDDTADED